MTVSVIVPNYNHAEYLKQRIESILNQTYRDFDIIILDDFSTDNSKEIIDDFTSRFPNIRSYINKCNSGSPFIQWDLGVNLAKGEFIWIAESDDFAEPKFLEKTVEIMTSSENLGLVYCDATVIDEQRNIEYHASKEKAHLNKNKWLNNYINRGEDEVADYLFKGNTINNVSGVLFRKDKYIEAGKADLSMKFCGDWFLYLRILLISDIGYISEPLNNYRFHSGSTIHDYFNSNTYLKEIFRIDIFLIKKIRLSPLKYLLMTNSLIMTILRRMYHLFKKLLK